MKVSRNVQRELEESKQHSVQLERVIHFLREKSEESKLELNQFQEEFQNSRSQVEILSQNLAEEIVQRKNAASMLQKAQEQQSQTELQIEELNARLTSLAQEKISLEEQIKAIQEDEDDKESRIRIAQQYLAKKVKEVSLLTEQIDEQNRLI